jgi:hypothetical protein
VHPVAARYTALTPISQASTLSRGPPPVARLNRDRTSQPLASRR